MTRVGKIARLPRHIREELNHRLDNGEVGSKLLEWLNSLPEVKQVLRTHFNSMPISKQNLSEWTQGGFQDWLRAQQAREEVQLLKEQSTDLENDSGGLSIADRIATLLSVQLLAATQQLEKIKDHKEHWLSMKDLLHELHRLRREDHHAARIRLAREESETRRERQLALDRKAKQEWNKKRLLKWLYSVRPDDDDALTPDGKNYARRWPWWVHCIEHDLRVPDDMPLPDWYFKDVEFWNFDSDSSPVTSEQSEDGAVEPETDEDEPVASESDEADSAQPDPSKAPKPVPSTPDSQTSPCQAESNQVKPNQTESNVGRASSLSPSSLQTVESIPADCPRPASA